MNLESSPKQEKSPDEKMKEIADEALVGIENVWKNYVEDLNGVFGFTDFPYQEIREDLEAHARTYGEALFQMARSTAGEERLRYADGFSHFLRIIGKNVKDRVLESLLTNKETVKELQRKTREELENSRRKPKNFLSRLWGNT